MSALVKPHKLHVVDVLGNVIGRDQPVMRIDKALDLVSLLDEKNFADNDTVFFDPFCKAGEILFACAYMSCSVKSKHKLMSTEEIYHEIFNSNRYFALAPDERHHRLSLRTFLGNKNSHEEKHNHIIRNGNYLSEIDGKLNKNKFKRELTSMIEYIQKTAGNKRIVAVGNPPYQEADKGFGGSANAVYNHFVETLMDSNKIDEFVVVIPSRWFAAGKGVGKFRDKVLNSKKIKKLRYFSKSKEVFPTVDVLGGVCFFHYSKEHFGDTEFIANKSKSQINISRFDIIPDDPKASEIVTKIMDKHHERWVSDSAWARKPFGLSTDWFKRNKECNKGHPQAIKCYSKGKKIKYITRDSITKNLDKVYYYKAVIPRAYAPGSKTGVRRVTLPVDQFFILDRDEITTETYTVVDYFKKKSDAEQFMRYLQTDFARYLLGLRKITQDIPRDRWAWVPYMDVNKDWTDETLFEHFELTDDEIKNIRKKVKEWS